MGLDHSRLSLEYSRLSLEYRTKGIRIEHSNARSSIGVIHKKGFTIRSSRPCGGAAAWSPTTVRSAALNGERASRRVEAWLRREM